MLERKYRGLKLTKKWMMKAPSCYFQLKLSWIDNRNPNRNQILDWIKKYRCTVTYIFSKKKHQRPNKKKLTQKEGNDIRNLKEVYEQKWKKNLLSLQVYFFSYKWLLRKVVKQIMAFVSLATLRIGWSDRYSR